MSLNVSVAPAVTPRAANTSRANPARSSAIAIASNADRSMVAEVMPSRRAGVTSGALCPNLPASTVNRCLVWALRNVPSAKRPEQCPATSIQCQGSGQSVAVLHHERSALGRSRGKVRQRQRALAGTHRSFRFGSVRQSRHRARRKRTYERTRAYAGHESAETSQGGACLHGNLH